MSISIVTLIAFVIAIMSAVALSVSRSDTLDTILYIVLYSGSVVAITTFVVGLISRLP
nr:MAG TPA: hypothetical protein [Caudoviricetes sp.]